jgi:AraC-like DNA-binding protein
MLDIPFGLLSSSYRHLFVTAVSLTPLDILHIIYLAIAIFGVLLVFGENRFKALFLLLGWHALEETFNLIEELKIFSQLPLVTPAIQLAVGPLYYLFAKNLIYGDIQLKKHLFHFFPMFIALGFTAWWPQLMQVAFVIFLIYFFLTFRLLQHYHKVLAEITSDAASYALKWLTRTFMVIGIIKIVDAVRLNVQLDVSYEVFYYQYFVIEILSLLITVYLTLKAIRHSHLFSGFKEFEEFVVPQKDQLNNESDIELEQARSIFSNIDKHLQQTHGYRQAKYSLRQLAGELGLTDQMVSWSINQGGNLSFSDYINSLRITEVKLSLRDKSQQKSILEVAFEAGFNSKSTFNAVFKQSLGLTPSQYIKKYL